MKSHSRMLHYSLFTHGIKGLLIALVCVAALFGCEGDKTTNVTNVTSGPTSTLGVLNVNVTPAAALVTVTGPTGFTAQTFDGAKLLTALTPGQYTAAATLSGYGNASSSINVVAGQTSSISLTLQATSIVPPTVTVGSLNVTVSPAAASVTVTGPLGFTQTFIGNEFLTNLTPGEYTAKATAAGYTVASNSINVVVGQTSSLSIAMQATPVVSTAPRVVYRDGQGNLIPLDSSKVQSGKFVFYAWLQDLPSGILTTHLTTSTESDPFSPLVAEQTEFAPSFTQNLAGAWVGYTDSTGVVRPVIGADVRWEIDQQWLGRVNSTQFGTSDDNGIGTGLGIFDDQSNTRTNNARLDNERFPLIATQYPLYDATGILTPYIDGFTWVTLFSPDAKASSRIVAVATINGEEIGKQILYKNFAPAPSIQITKSVDTNLINLDNTGGVGTVNWTVAVTNVGAGDATVVNLNDILTSGAGTTYTLTPPAGGTATAGNDGFTSSFALASGSTLTLTFPATVTAAGTYCNEGIITSYAGATSTVTPVDLNAQACFTAINSNVSIFKDFVAADNATSLGKARTVGTNVPAKLRVRVINASTSGSATISISDTLNGGASAAYTLSGLSSGTTNSLDGFNTANYVLTAGSTTTVLFNVAASADGTYCDTATVTSTGPIGVGSDSACLTVASPNLSITKTDVPASVLPAGNYTSTIGVHNSGTATANDVVISDLLGQNASTGAYVIYVSSSQNGVAGILSANTVTANSISLASGGTATFTVVSRIPAGASGSFCDTGTVTSSNAATKQATACVNVPSYVALQTQLVDLNDPVQVGSSVTYASVLYVEALSNEGASNTKLTYSFGMSSPTVLGVAGLFQVTNTQIYLDTAPVRDPVTGLVVSDPSNASATLLTNGTDYTLDNTTPGLQKVTMATGVILQPNTALYVRHVCLVPSGTPINHLYTTSYIWDSVGLTSGTAYEASSSEPTTVTQ